MYKLPEICKISGCSNYNELKEKCDLGRKPKINRCKKLDNEDAIMSEIFYDAFYEPNKQGGQ